MLLTSVCLLLTGPCLAASLAAATAVQHKPIELHHRLSPPTAVALTLDACSGAVDQRLIELLVQLRVPATLFVTKRRAL
jgi:peptidoglycan/xylan/chitin deacetylase (PgdA/CDA1 family)